MRIVKGKSQNLKILRICTSREKDSLRYISVVCIEYKAAVLLWRFCEWESFWVLWTKWRVCNCRFGCCVVVVFIALYSLYSPMNVCGFIRSCLFVCLFHFKKCSSLCVCFIFIFFNLILFLFGRVRSWHFDSSGVKFFLSFFFLNSWCWSLVLWGTSWYSSHDTASVLVLTVSWCCLCGI